MLRKVLAILIGAGAAFAMVAIVESMGQSVYPPPPNLDFNNAEQVGEYIQNAPIGAFGFILGAWVVAVVIGGFIAAFIARKVVFAVVIGVLVLAASAVNLFMIPHPTWFSITGIIVIIAAIILTKRLVRIVFGLT
jgi:hypothetical protein